MKLKVCGIADRDSAEQLAKLPVEYLGVIFAEKSPRYVSVEKANEIIGAASEKEWVGVFVDPDIKEVAKLVGELKLSVVQLHGNESWDTVYGLRDLLPNNVAIWKAIGVDKESSLDELLDIPHVDSYLFDTKSLSGDMGGTGEKFDWSVLEKLSYKKPIVLSGGIGPDDVHLIKDIITRVPSIQVIDVNSKFETLPGKKNFQVIKSFTDTLENEGLLL